MNRHPFAEWGIAHLSHPDDQARCCHLPEDHLVHRPKYWRTGEPIAWPASVAVPPGDRGDA